MQAYGRDILFKVMDTIVEISKEQERRIMQIEMIKNFYPEYTENNYVLWIIPNLFTDSETTHINGKIKVIKDGDVLDIPIVSNSPYPNKKVCQLSLHARDNTCFGIPLVFSSFEELKQITEINIYWDIFTYDQLEDLDVYYRPYIQSLQMHYEIKFSEGSLENQNQKRFYTLFAKDTVHDGKKLAYETVYDHLDCVDAAVKCDNGKWTIQEYVIDYLCQNNNHVTKEMMKKNLQRLSEDECLDIITRMTEKCIDKYLKDYSNDGDAIRYISQFDSMSDETVDYVFSEVYANISPFATDKMLIKALRRSDKSITPEDLENGYDIFVCGHVYTKLQMMIINQFCKFFEQREKTEPILFLMDEFQNFGKIENFAAYLDVLNNEKIEVMIFIHSKKQLDVIYGKDQADKICNNCTYKVILQVYDPVTQKWCSELAGICEKLRHKKLMQPEEFGDLEDVFCIFPTGCCRIKKIKYWEEELFKKN